MPKNIGLLLLFIFGLLIQNIYAKKWVSDIKPLNGILTNSQELPSETPDSTVVEEYSLSEIVQKANDDLITVEDFANRISDTTLINELALKLAEVQDQYELLSDDSRNTNLERLTYRELDNLNKTWGQQKNSIESLISDYGNTLDQFDEESQRLSDMRTFWEQYLQDNVSREHNTALIEKIRTISQKVGEINPLYEARFGTLLDALNSLNRLDSKVSNRIEKIEVQLSGLDNLLERSSPPLWTSLRNFNFSGTGSEFSRGLKRTGIDLSNAFKFFIGTHFLVVLMILVFYILTIRTRDQPENYRVDYTLFPPNLKDVFQFPLASTLVMTFIFAYYLYAQLPTIFLDLLGFIVIGALYVVAKLVFGKLLIKYIRVLIVCWLAIKFVDIVSFQSLSGRTILLLFNVYLIYWLNNLRKEHKLLDHFKGTKFGGKVVDLSLVIVLLTVGLSFVLNILGYITLAYTLSSIVVKLSLLSLYLYLWRHIMILFIAMRMEGKYFSSKPFIYENKVKLLGFLNKLVNLFAYVVFILSVLTLTNVSILVFEEFWELLNTPIPIGSLSFTAWSIILFVLIIWLAMLISTIIQTVLREEVLLRADLDRGLPDTISMLVRYVIIAIGFFVAVTSLGLKLDQLAIIFGAFSVGIGFGLQNIFNNLVSGLILIFERPIRIDDTIEINNMVGNVSSIGIRSSSVRTFEGAEVIVPNGHLISNEVINWTLSDKNRRIEIIVGVAYGSDIHKVLRLLKSVLESNNNVIRNPQPLVIFEEFGDSSLNFRLLFWTDNNSEWLRIKSEILFEINDVFVAENIEIPFPQRDLNIKSFLKPGGESKEN